MTIQEKEQWLEEIMIEYGDDLVKLAFHYVRNEETAKDLVQNTFIKCYKHINHFRNDSSVKTWLYRITINECKDYLKSWHYRKVHARNFLEHTITSLLPSTENAILQKEKQKEIKGYILSLPQKYREVISLYYYQGFSMEEISDMTNTKLNTVKTRLSRAKQKLKNVIGEENIYG